MAKHISREIQIEWDGEVYTFAPTNKLLRRIDAGLAPQTVLGILGLMDGTNVPLPALAYILSEMIQAGGGDADEDDVLAGLYDDMQNNDSRGIEPLMDAMAAAIAPPSGAAKNLAAPEKAGAAVKRKPRKK